MTILSIVFKRIIEMSMLASIAGLVILGIQKLLKKRISPKWRNYLWIAFLLILINPISLESHFSIYNIIPVSTMNQEEKKETLDKHTNLKSIYAFQNEMEFEENSIHDEKENILSNLVIYLQQNSINISDVLTIMSVLYCGITVFSLCKTLWTWRRISQRMKQPFQDKRLEKILEKVKNKLSISQEIELIKQEELKTPAIFGSKHTKIFLTETILTLSDEEIELIFLHELMHFKKKDIVLNQLIIGLKSFYWFNPILNYLFHRMKQDMELANDENVLEILEDSKMTTYCKTLLKVSQLSNVPLSNVSFSNMPLSNTQVPFALGIGSYFKEMEERIKMIKEKNKFLKNRGLLTTVIVTLVLGITVCFATSRMDYNVKETVSGEEIIDEGFEGNNFTVVYENEQEKEQENTQENTQQGILIASPLKELKVTAAYGKRIHPITKREISHDGIDLKAEKGEAVMAITNGIVEETGFSAERGNYIIVKHENAETFFSLYAHLSEIEVEVGDVVGAGMEIGKAGSTGMATGPHLHLGIMNEENETMNPAELLKIEE